MDFMSDALAGGQKLRVLTVLDTYTREYLALEVGLHFRGGDVAQVLTRVGVERGLPSVNNVDNRSCVQLAAGVCLFIGVARLKQMAEGVRSGYEPKSTDGVGQEAAGEAEENGERGD